MHTCCLNFVILDKIIISAYWSLYLNFQISFYWMHLKFWFFFIFFFFILFHWILQRFILKLSWKLRRPKWTQKRRNWSNHLSKWKKWYLLYFSVAFNFLVFLHLYVSIIILTIIFCFTWQTCLLYLTNLHTNYIYFSEFWVPKKKISFINEFEFFFPMQYVVFQNKRVIWQYQRNKTSSLYWLWKGIAF